MTNVLQYLLQLSEEQKAMFQSMSERVDDMEDHVALGRHTFSEVRPTQN